MFQLYGLMVSGLEFTGVPRSYEPTPPVALCLGTKGDPWGAGVSYERVRFRVEGLGIRFRF
jgi:hypothetical protein